MIAFCWLKGFLSYCKVILLVECDCIAINAIWVIYLGKARSCYGLSYGELLTEQGR